MKENEIAKIVVNAAYEVHRQLGPGLLESVYEHCLFYELRVAGLNITQQHPLPVIYKEVRLDCGFRLDIWAENKVIVEIKSVEAMNNVHLAQVLTYLKLTNNRLGLLINFNVHRIKDGIKRVANGMEE